MRASDLTEYSYTDKKIEKILTKKGYKKLGAGVDQTAYLEPGTGFVLKIFGTQRGDAFSADQEMFFDWAKYCMKNKNNPFLPKFGGYESFVLDGDRYLQIRQEALKSSGVTGRVLAIMAVAIEEEGAQDLGEVEDVIDELYDEYANAYQKFIKQLGPKATQKLFNTMMDLYKISLNNGWMFDLHSGNFMLRNDGTPVIVDPWALA